MTERSVTHGTFVIERTYPASPARVFAAFADPAIKDRWFGGPEEWDRGEGEMDFRVGGREVTGAVRRAARSTPSTPAITTSSQISGSSSPTISSWTRPGSRSRWRRSS